MLEQTPYFGDICIFLVQVNFVQNCYATDLAFFRKCPTLYTCRNESDFTFHAARRIHPLPRTVSTTMNFNLLRLIAALLVVLGHSFELTRKSNFGIVGDPMRMLLGTETIAGAGVICFFAISGYLVTLSAVRTENTVEFLWKRAIRIVPAFWVLIVVSALILGPILTTMPFAEYFQNRSVHQYLMGLFFKLGETLPGVFDKNPHSNVVNGSLWSLPLEVKCYLMVAGMMFFGRKWLRPFLICALVAMGVTVAIHIIRGPTLVPFFRLESTLFIKLVLPFLLGSTVAVYGTQILAKPSRYFVLLVLVSVVSFFFPSFQQWAWLSFSVCMALLVLSIGTNNDSRSSLTDGVVYTFGVDISYGVYLWAFPIQQTLLHLFPAISSLFLVLSTLAIVVPIAYVSWTCVERPMLTEKKWLSKHVPSLLRFGRPPFSDAHAK
jgi:peptidoglycan/LPS O-acetylase OafA/YrhL